MSCHKKHEICTKGLQFSQISYYYYKTLLIMMNDVITCYYYER